MLSCSYPVSIGPYGDFGHGHIFRHFLFNLMAKHPTVPSPPSATDPRPTSPTNAQPSFPPPSALLLLPQSLGKRTNHVLSSDIPTLHLPPENYSSSNLASIPESTRSPASQLIPQHCSRSCRSQGTANPPLPQADPHPTQFTFSDASMLG